jgi:thiol-disulfide isomerase/thioredoxin
LRPITLLKRGLCLSALLLFCGVRLFAANGFAQGDILDKDVLDLQGRAVNPLAPGEGKVVVLIFVRTDCPISNRYAPEIKRLAAKYASPKVDFWLVYPNADESAEAVRRHLKDYGYELGALRDPRHALVKLTGVSVTPEAAVFVRGEAAQPGVPVYRGRIDDRFVAFGKMRPEPTTRDLEEVLDALRQDKQVAPRRTAAVGCFISEQ